MFRRIIILALMGLMTHNENMQCLTIKNKMQTLNCYACSIDYEEKDRISKTFENNLDCISLLSVGGPTGFGSIKTITLPDYTKKYIYCATSLSQKIQYIGHINDSDDRIICDGGYLDCACGKNPGQIVLAYPANRYKCN